MPPSAIRRPQCSSRAGYRLWPIRATPLTNRRLWLQSNGAARSIRAGVPPMDALSRRENRCRPSSSAWRAAAGSRWPFYSPAWRDGRSPAGRHHASSRGAAAGNGPSSRQPRQPRPPAAPSRSAGTNWNPGEVVSLSFDLQPSSTSARRPTARCPPPPSSFRLARRAGRHHIVAFGQTSRHFAFAAVTVVALHPAIRINRQTSAGSVVRPRPPDVRRRPGFGPGRNDTRTGR